MLWSAKDLSYTDKPAPDFVREDSRPVSPCGTLAARCVDSGFRCREE